jgi:hypothetical protein
LINNRQNGRRRGRGGPRPQGNPGQPGGGNRIDSRARGNAQQLHEKYRNLARDSQMAGDRVTTEYYLQFADHYFRVLNESRARFDDQRRQRDDSDEEFDGEDEFDARDQQGQGHGQGQGQNQGQRQSRDRDHRQDERRDEGRRDSQPVQAEGDQARSDGESHEQQADEGQRRQRRPRRPREDSDQAPRVEALEADRLPPSIAVASGDSEEAPAPRRRTRRPRAEAANDPVEVPPAA